MTNRSIGIALGTALVLSLAAPASAQQAKCLAGKTGCMAKKAVGLLKCEALAETPGKPPDPNDKNCVTKVRIKFDGGSDPAKGCFEKLENKVPNDCLPVDNTAAAETAVDACVAAVVAAIDPPPLDQSKCGAGKKKCASKYLAALLQCRRLSQTPGKPTDPNTKDCVDKAAAKYTGGTAPTKGCFAKLEAKADDCQSTTDSPTVQALVENCLFCNPVDCDDENPCTTDVCDPLIGCIHTAVDCSDGLQCTDDTCNPLAGCSHPIDTSNCVVTSSCETFLCGIGVDCTPVFNHDLCPPFPGVYCLAPLCTAAGCGFQDTCTAQDPNCDGCASCSCAVALGKCVKTCPS
jgi:hypothetical protein